MEIALFMRAGIKGVIYETTFDELSARFINLTWLDDVKLFTLPRSQVNIGEAALSRAMLKTRSRASA